MAITNDSRVHVAERTGIGLRLPHIAEVVATHPPVGWLEIHPENFLANPHGLELLTDLARDYPISVHTVGISIGSADGIDQAHLTRVRAMVDRLNPVLVSGHLAWSVHGGAYLNDLLPLPYTKETLRVVATHLAQVQDALGRAYVIENPSTYVSIATSTMTEIEFLHALVDVTGCRLLCDVSNVYLSGHNMGYDPYRLHRQVSGGSGRGAPSRRASRPKRTRRRPAPPCWWIRMRRRSPNRPGTCTPMRFAGLGRSPRSSSGITICQRWRSWRERPPKPIAFANTHTRPAMPALADIQSAIRDALVHGDRTALAPMLSGGVHPEYRLAIHQRHYAASLTRALLDRFPATVWLVGSELVTDAATSFIREQPPSKPCIAEYGESFPQHLGAHPAAASLPYLSQFAELEWHLGRLALATENRRTCTISIWTGRWMS